jgi:hypothetical protein
MLITLSSEELELCKKFSDKCALEQQSIEFGQHDTAPRSAKEIGRNNLIGKLTEVAFAKFLKEQYGIEVELDFQYYPRGEWDGQDMVIHGWKIDVKGTRRGGHWLLVEWNKLAFRQQGRDLPDLFVMGSVFWNRENDCPTGQVELIGVASTKRLQKGASNVSVFHKGDRLPGTKGDFKLQADNFGIPFSELASDWAFVISYLLNHNPPSLDDYPNPYTGETYKTLFPHLYQKQ